MNDPTTHRVPIARRFQRYGPRAVVTGASDGLGRAIATELAAAGLDLVLVARRSDVLEALAQELTDRHGVDARVLPADLATPEGIADLVEGTRQDDVGLLVASAGFGTAGDFLDHDVEVELGMLDVNCRAVLALSHHFGRRFAERGRGGLVLMSSLFAFQGVPGSANYAATKAYVQSLAEGLRLELGRRGVDVLATAPGPVATGFAARADMMMGAALAPAVVARGTLAALGRRGTARPGWLSWFLEASLALLPRWARSRILGTVVRGFTAHQRERHPGPSSALTPS